MYYKDKSDRKEITSIHFVLMKEEKKNAKS